MTRRSKTLIVGGLVLLLLIGVATVGLISGAGTPGSARPATTPTPPSRPAPSLAPTLPTTSDAVRYARAYAQQLFGWDTRSEATPSDYETALFPKTAATGDDSNGYSADLAAYYPSPDAWTLLATLHAAQTLKIDHAVVPAGWDTVAAQASLTATAVTIDGIRHRTGIEDGTPISNDTPVAFTVFLDCPGTGCRVLRLSQPNKPLR